MGERPGEVPPVSATADRLSPEDHRWRVLFLAASAVMLAGLLLDAWAHRYRPESDVGHSVLVIGGTIVVVGAVVMLLAPRLYRQPVTLGRWRALQVAAPVVVLGIVTPAMVAAASAATRHPTSAPGSTVGAVDAAAAHSHDATTVAPHGHEDDTGTAVGTMTPSADAPLTAGEALGEEITGNKVGADGTIHDHGHGSEVPPDQPLDPATRTQLAEQLVVARDAALSFPTLAEATKAGYIMVTPYVPLIGAHYINFRYVDRAFDPAKPEMLLYDGTEPGAKVVGLSYFVASPTYVPAGFAGPNDHWHQHVGLCLKGTVVVGGERITPEECTRRGGSKVGLTDMWMVHAWVVPGWDSPQGVFSPEHAGLV